MRRQLRRVPWGTVLSAVIAAMVAGALVFVVLLSLANHELLRDNAEHTTQLVRILGELHAHGVVTDRIEAQIQEICRESHPNCAVHSARPKG